MDPGNWATAIQGGSQFGYNLLFVVVLSSLAAIVLQCLAMRLGIVTGKDLAVHCREQYHPATAKGLWFFAELSIIACDLAEVLGCALAFHLLLGIPLPAGVLLTALDTLIVLGLKGKGFRQLEAIVLGLIATIGICLFAELLLVKPDLHAVLAGVVPSLQKLAERDALYLAIGILGATVMPHNLYLHSSVVQTRVVRRGATAGDAARLKEAIGMSRIDTVISLGLALFINGAILVLAAAAFYKPGGGGVMEIDQAYELLAPVAGTALAAFLFGLALLASGQSSTFTGTIAGQVIMQGKRVAILMTDGVEQVEYTGPRSFLEQQGAQVTLVSPKASGEEIQGFNHMDLGDKFKVEMTRARCAPGRLRRPGAAGRRRQSGPAAPVGGGDRLHPRIRPRQQTDRRHLPWSVDPDRRRPRHRQAHDQLADPAARPAERGRRVERRAGGGGRQARHQPQAGRHPGSQAASNPASEK
jgi:NRAMP (natural resistance-associated macrophage protein)-like metal ion transporter